MKNEVLQTWRGFNIYFMHPVPGAEPQCPHVAWLCDASVSIHAPAVSHLDRHCRHALCGLPRSLCTGGVRQEACLKLSFAFLHLPASFSCSHVPESLTWVTKEGQHGGWEAPRSWLPSAPPPVSLPVTHAQPPWPLSGPDSHVLRPPCTCPPPSQSDAIRMLLALLPLLEALQSLCCAL